MTYRVRVTWSIAVLVLMFATTFSAPFVVGESVTGITGTLSIMLGDSEIGKSCVSYYLHTGPGQYLQIYPDVPVPLSYNGMQVSIVGATTRVDNRTVVTATSIVPLGSPASAAVTGTRKIAMLLLKYSDSASYTPNDPTYYTSLVNPASNSLNGFYREESYTLLSVQADVFGWYTLPQPRNYYVYGTLSTCGVYFDRIVTDAVAVSDPAVNFPLYNDVSFVMNDYLDCCAWGGGCTISADGMTKSYGATWMPPWAQNIGVYAHEVGHAIGCPHTGWVYGTYDSVWDVESGGDRFHAVLRGSYYSVAAGGTRNLYSYDPCHHVAYHKVKLGWLDGWYSETSTGTSTVTVNALAGTRISYMAVKVRIPGQDPAKRYFTVEARTKINYDQWLPGEGIIIHCVDEDRIAGGLGGQTRVPAYPIDSTPGTATLNDAQWIVGGTYLNSTHQISITVLSKAGNSYQVRIMYGTGPDLIVESIWVEGGGMRAPGAAVSSVITQGSPSGTVRTSPLLRPGESYIIWARIRNIGTTPAVNYYLDAYMDSSYGRGGPATLNPGATEYWHWGPWTAAIGGHVTLWVVNPKDAQRIQEFNYDNNDHWYTFAVRYGAIFFDSYESYLSGAFPTGGGWTMAWNGAGDQYQVVTNSTYVSKSQSLQLLGQMSWSSIVYKTFSSTSTSLAYQAHVKTEAYGSSYTNALVGFFNKDMGTYGKYYAAVNFDSDGKIYSGGTALQSYNPNSWYKIKVHLYRSINRYNVYINDVLIGRDLQAADTLEINSLALGSEWASARCYFDNVMVEEDARELGSAKIVYSASPSKGQINQAVTFSGTLYASSCYVKDGVVPNRPVWIRAPWGFWAGTTTNSLGVFSISTTCPPDGGTYDITAIFCEDEDLTGTSTTFAYLVEAYIETTLSLTHRYESGGMGGARRFYGYLREKNSGLPVPNKIVRLTIYGGGYGYIFDVTTNSLGYYDYLFTTNGGIFTWAEARFAGFGLYLASFSGRIYPSSGSSSSTTATENATSTAAASTTTTTATTTTTIEYIETALTLTHRYESGGMGGSRRFYGYLKEKNSGLPASGKTVRLTIYSGSYAYIFDVTTNSQGYYDYLFTANSGIFTWAEARFSGSGLHSASFSGRIYP